MATTGWSFTGRRTDSTGLEYYRARYYSSAAGAFTQRDPFPIQAIDDTTTTSGNPSARSASYQYVLQNPSLLIDPSGFIARNSVVARITAIFASIAANGVNTPAARDAMMELRALIGNASYSGAELARRAGVPIQRAVTAAFQSTVNTTVRIATRIPDLAATFEEEVVALGEIKSGELCNLRWSDQLQTFANYANAQGTQFFLFVNGSLSQLAQQNPGFLNRAAQANVVLMDIHQAVRSGFRF